MTTTMYAGEDDSAGAENSRRDDISAGAEQGDAVVGFTAVNSSLDRRNTAKMYVLIFCFCAGNYSLTLSCSRTDPDLPPQPHNTPPSITTPTPDTHHKSPPSVSAGAGTGSQTSASAGSGSGSGSNSGSGSDSPETAASDTNSHSKNYKRTSPTASSASQSAKRRKGYHACIYCRRSHMTCDSERPCSRCVRRNIGHLCRDENPTTSPSAIKEEPQTTTPPTTTTSPDKPAYTYEISSQGITAPLSIGNSAQASPEASAPADWTAAMMTDSTVDLLTNLTPYQQPLFYSEGAGNEFSSLNDFLTLIEDVPQAHQAHQAQQQAQQQALPEQAAAATGQELKQEPELKQEREQEQEPRSPTNPARSETPDVVLPTVHNPTTLNHPSLEPPAEQNPLSARANGNLTLTTPTRPIQVPETAKDKFFLTAADPADGPEHTPEERLKQVINAKLEAGLLAPYNYVKGYARLQRYMDRHMAAASRQRILKPLSIFRPAFRAIAQTLIDVDLVLVEEAFERMLLDYDRVFTSMAIPACLWRRTGEIYRGNKEFAALVEVPVEDLRDGKIAIYEVLSEDSAVNYWEKYGNIAFDSGQKAVLTSCTLRSRDGRTRRSCCFSFTIRRDRYNIPSCIIGNFIPIHP
ncbi:hypothetical protein BZA70DRAFT_296781 [Myxozyma melibiosi]|uniref:Zn(2)-C6 fungal-type domain-containing protein n=1 Tax=Myxozyma melibiosi TaxID=54550 RepID=A0ABR1F290_9ASCO